jgi:hypothetical protein
MRLHERAEAPPEPNTTSSQRARSRHHLEHDGIADSLHVLLPFWAQALGLNYAQLGSLKTAYSAAWRLSRRLLASRLTARSPCRAPWGACAVSGQST